MTLLYPQDLHWGNFLERDDGTIVVVDLGLFKNTGDFRKDKQKLAAAKQNNNNKKYCDSSKKYAIICLGGINEKAIRIMNAIKDNRNGDVVTFDFDNTVVKSFLNKTVDGVEQYQFGGVNKEIIKKE